MDAHNFEIDVMCNVRVSTSPRRIQQLHTALLRSMSVRMRVKTCSRTKLELIRLETLLFDIGCEQAEGVHTYITSIRCDGIIYTYACV